MNIPENILDYLIINGSAAVPAFGIFALENARAEIAADKDRILPPSKQVVFSADYQIDNPDFIHYLGSKNQLSENEAEAALKGQTDYWKKMILEGRDLELFPLGKFHSSGEGLQFKGEKIITENPDFYGLEEIKLSEIRKKGRGGSYSVNKAVLWTAVMLAIAGLAAATFISPEAIFGNKSFESKSLKVRAKPGKPDSLATTRKISDSLKMDSLKRDSLAKSAVLPAKNKWGGTNKYYKKSKWSKSKRHRTH